MFRRIAIKTFLIFFLAVSQSYAFWIWNPKDKTFTNPKWSAKDTPEKQLEFAKQTLDSAKEPEGYKNALVEFKKVLKYFPESKEAAEAQFYTGNCLEYLEKPYDAYLAYQKVIDKYPFSERLNEILQRQFEIATSFAEVKKKFIGLSLPQYYYALIIYRKIIENSPYHKLAGLSQYRIGLVLKSVNSFEEAKKEFEKLISSYADSEWVEPAKFQVALCASLASKKSDYDQELTQEAKERFKEFLSKHPEAELTQQAKEQVNALTEKEIEKDFNTAQFYEKQMAYPSAKIYYEGIIKKYPGTIWAEKSFERINILEKEGKL